MIMLDNSIVINFELEKGILKSKNLGGFIENTGC